MKVYFNIITFIIITNLSNINTQDIIPDIDLRNFDIRERFYNCYNPGYDADLIVNN